VEQRESSSRTGPSGKSHRSTQTKRR